MTPPPTPSRSAANGMSQQPSTPYHQQQPMSAQHPVYSPIFFPLQANVSSYHENLKRNVSMIQMQMPFVPMAGTYIIPQGPSPSHHPVRENNSRINDSHLFLFSNCHPLSIQHSILKIVIRQQVDN